MSHLPLSSALYPSRIASARPDRRSPVSDLYSPAPTPKVRLLRRGPSSGPRVRALDRQTQSQAQGTLRAVSRLRATESVLGGWGAHRSSRVSALPRHPGTGRPGGSPRAGGKGRPGKGGRGRGVRKRSGRWNGSLRRETGRRMRSGRRRRKFR